MSCNEYELLRLNYPRTIIAMFFSSTEIAPAQTNGHIPNTIGGYLTELEDLGQANAAVGSRALIAAPYPTRMRPLTRLSSIYQSQDVLLKDIEFIGYDTTLTGATNQDAATIAEVYASRATNDAYAQSIYKNAMINNWQPNFLRPEFYVDGKNVLDFLSDNDFDQPNAGDRSIGIPLGKCFDLSIQLGKVRDVNVHAQLAQYIALTGLYQRYPLLCTATFWVK
jgi:hypothetical protein